MKSKTGSALIGNVADSLGPGLAQPVSRKATSSRQDKPTTIELNYECLYSETKKTYVEGYMTGNKKQISDKLEAKVLV